MYKAFKFILSDMKNTKIKLKKLTNMKSNAVDKHNSIN